MPVLAAWMHPRSFLVVGQSEYGVSDQKVVGSTSLKKQQTIVIA